MNAHLLAGLSTGPDVAAALSVDDSTLSTSELRDAALGFAASLPDAGPVAVLATAQIETAIAIVGCLLAGVPVVPVPPDSGPAELRHVLADSAATVWVGPRTEGVDLPTLRVGAGGRSTGASYDVRPDDPAIILYTSGTTGAPKGVTLSHRAIGAGLDALVDAWDWTADDTLVHGLPLFHTHGLILGVLGPLRVGARVHHTGRPTPERYAAADGTMYFGVPTVWSRIAADPAAARSLSKARLLVSGSAPLPVPVFDAISALAGQAPVERYGMTETMITLSTRADGERRPGWVGLPVPGAETRVRAEDGSEVACDSESIGRLEVRGPMLFDGYLGRPTTTAESFTADGWFVTGDIAAARRAGLPPHRRSGVGRPDQVGRLSHRRRGDRGIPAGATRGQRGRRGRCPGSGPRPADRRLGRARQARPTDAVARALIDHVAQDLSWHKRPREVRFTDALPRNAMGKVQKTKLS